MKKKFYLITALLLALALSGGIYAYTWTTATATIGITEPTGDIATWEPALAEDQPDWDLVLPTPGAVVTETIASDDFESGGWYGGSGWLYEWWHEGYADVTTSGTPHGGSYHLMLRGSSGYVDRGVNLSGQTNVRLQFWAKANSFEAGEFADCLVSPDGTNWTIVQTWVDGDDDNIYRFYDIDLSGFTMTSEFWIGFDAEMSGTDDYLYIDDLEVVSSWEAPPVIEGEVPTGDLFIVTPHPDYTGDLLVKVYLTNTGALIKAYQYLNMKLYLEGSVEAPDYRLLTLQNGEVAFNLEAPHDPSHTLSVIGGSYCLVSDDPLEWGTGWSITPEFYCEVTQR